MPPPDRGFVEELARDAGAVLLRHLGRLEHVAKKGARDLVTAADHESEALIVARLRDAFPDVPVLAEESLGSQGAAARLWIVDPLDGTTNFVYQIPHFAVSVAYCEDGVPVVACVLNPVLDTCYVAARGQGATCNGRPVRCREETELSEALLGTGLHYRREFQPDSNLQHMVDFGCRARGLRRIGSAALDLCYVAEGRLDGFWEPWLEPWDVAGGALVAQESGCAVTDFDGGSDWLFGRRIVAANPDLAARIREVLAAADPAKLPGPRHPA